MSLEQKDLDEFLQTLAAAILAWQKVEMNLFLVFDFLVGPHRNPKVLSATYHSVVNLNIRLRMIDAAAAVALADTAYLAEWQKLSKRVLARAKKRNVLVHFGLVNHMNDRGEPDSLRLQPSIFDVTEKPDLQYDVKQIWEWQESFIALWQDLNVFLDGLPPALRS